MTRLAGEDLEYARRVAEDLAEYAAERILSHRPDAVETWTKANPADWATAVDLEIEQHVREQLQRLLPEYGIVGEEMGSTGPTGPDDCRWFCDPIDGTTNFVHGLAWSSFSLALADEDGLALGIVCDPYRSELFAAIRGEGARLNGSPIHCSTSAGLHGGVVLSEQNGAKSWDGMLGMIEELGSNQCVTHFLGSSALALVNFAAGRASGVVLGAANPIDVAGGLIVARESGGIARGAPGVDRALSVDASLRRGALAVATSRTIEDLERILC